MADGNFNRPACTVRGPRLGLEGAGWGLTRTRAHRMDVLGVGQNLDQWDAFNGHRVMAEYGPQAFIGADDSVPGIDEQDDVRRGFQNASVARTRFAGGPQSVEQARN